jgi:two-component system OmpR family sensor kinase/two-component system sensor histidine kinase BaeS
MNKLWLRLALAFGLVIVVTIVITAWWANRQVGRQFSSFVVRNQAGTTLAPTLIDYYAANGAWQGVEQVFPLERGRGRGMMWGMQRGQGPPAFILSDASGEIVYNERGGASAARQLSLEERQAALPLTFQEQTVGYLLVDTPPGSRAQLVGPARTFLQEANRSLLQAGLLAGGVALLLSLMVARGLTVSLGRLSGAAQKIAAGDLSQRVEPQGADELRNLAMTFNEMAAHLQQAEQLRRNLVADVAHELRTPVSVIQGNLQAILDGVYPLDKAEIATLYDETLTLNRLIHDLRELAQAEAGQLSLNLQPTDLRPLLSNTVDLFAEPAREKQLALRLDLPADLPAVHIDPDRVRQVLNNLLSNAMRHTPPGGHIAVAAACRETAVEISISDTGLGLNPQEMSHVFDRFWRGDKSRTRQQGGSGLGLAIAKQLVEAQGGSIGVESKEEQGSRFWFTLPAPRGAS